MSHPIIVFGPHTLGDYLDNLPKPIRKLEKQAILMKARWDLMHAEENLKSQEDFRKLSHKLKPKAKKTYYQQQENGSSYSDIRPSHQTTNSRNFDLDVRKLVH